MRSLTPLNLTREGAERMPKITHCREEGCDARHRSGTGLCRKHRPALSVVVNHQMIQIGGRFVVDRDGALDLANRLVDAAEGMDS